jgi:uroporphyrinogen III methyltransferase/synthase
VLRHVTRIVVTRAREQAGELVGLLEDVGYEVVVCPLIDVTPLGDEPIDVSSYDWVVITSANGALELRRRMRGRPRRVAAIGRATAAAFGEVDLIPETATQEGLLAELPRPAGRVLFAGAEGARQLIVRALDADFLPLYRTREVRPPALPAGDLAVLASPSAARALAVLELRLPVVSIGPETTRAAEAVGLTVLAEAASHDTPGLVAAVQGVIPS